MDEIKLGDKVRDKVSGYEGIATSKTEYLNGCFQIEVTPRLKKGKLPTAGDIDGIAFDTQQLEKIGNGINTLKKKVKKSDNGGPPRRVPRRMY